MDRCARCQGTDIACPLLRGGDSICHPLQPTPLQLYLYSNPLAGPLEPELTAALPAGLQGLYLQNCRLTGGLDPRLSLPPALVKLSLQVSNEGQCFFSFAGP